MVAALDGTLSLFAGAVALGLIHGAEPGHGWPVAATYALDRRRTWVQGVVASTLLGLGHLVSSVAVVVVFFLASDYLGLTQLGWIRYVAGVLLVGLGIREYRHGYSHGRSDPAHEPADHDQSGQSQVDHDHRGHAHRHHDHSHHHDHDSQQHEHNHEHEHSHGHLTSDDVDRKGLAGIVWAAFVLGFAHEEEFEIIGLCLGSPYCLELMLVYALAVLAALVALTLAFVGGFRRYGDRVEGLADHLPTVSAVVLVALGLGFIAGVV